MSTCVCVCVQLHVTTPCMSLINFAYISTNETQYTYITVFLRFDRCNNMQHAVGFGWSHCGWSALVGLAAARLIAWSVWVE